MRNNSVIIATDAGFYAESLREKLRDAECRVFTASTVNEFTAKIKANAPQFVFIEHCFYGPDTETVIFKMAQRNRNMHIVVWSASKLNPRTAARFYHAGAESFIPLRDSDGNIAAIIRRIASGLHYWPADVEELLMRDSEIPVFGAGLTKREKEVFKLTVGEKDRKQIGKELGISVPTVQFHRGNIYRKCGGNTPLGMLVNGLKRGIIHEDDL